MSIETAGARLKKIRQERGISLEELQKKTKIHLNILRAIEGDSISDLSPIYLKGFIKIYCSALGIDPKDYTGSSAPLSRPALNATVGKSIGERVERTPVSFIKDASTKIGSFKPPAHLKKRIILGVALFITIFLAVKLVKFISSRPKTKPERAKISMPVQAPKIVAKQQPKAKLATNLQKDLADGFTVGIFARSKSWISAKVDGKVIFHGVLAKGRNETWSDREKVELSLGDAGAVELQVNDQRFDNLGRRGKPLKNILINKEGLKIPR